MMSESDKENTTRKRRVSLGDAMDMQRAFDSAQTAAIWAISEFEDDFKSSDEPIEKRVPSILRRLKNRISNAVNRRKKSKKELPAEELQQPALTNSMVDVLDAKSEPDKEEGVSRMGAPCKSFDDVTLSSQRQKLKPIIEKLKEVGDELGGKTPTELCGRILQEINYVHDRKLALVGRAIYDGSFGEKYCQKTEMSEPEALYMKTHELELSDGQYTNQRLRLLPRGTTLPALYKVKDYEKGQRYPLIPELGGFRATLPEISKTTLTQIFQIPEVGTIVGNLPASAFPLIVELDTGFDGSSGQQTAMQKSRNGPDENNPANPWVSQQNRETVVAVFKLVKTQSDEKVWGNEKNASVNSCRPYAIYPQKENRELMEKFLKYMDAEKKELDDSEQMVPLPSGREVAVKVNANLRLADGKAVKEATGLGGAYCLVGTCSKESGHDIDCIKAGFEINRSMEKANEIFQQLFDKEIGAIKKTKKDNETRQGVTNKPLTNQAINLSPRPLHCMLRVYNLFQRLLYKTYAEVLAERNPQIEKDWEKESRLIVIDAVKDTGVVMDTPTSKGGTTDTGNAAKRFFSAEVIPSLEKLFPPDKVDDILTLHKNFSIILRVISSKRQVDTTKLKSICTDTYLFLRSNFPSISVSETAHMVLGHSFQLIELNDGYGLGQMSEQGLEAINKLVRRFSERFARHRSLDANIIDVINRLQVLSNPYLLTFQRKPSCSRCNTTGEHWTHSCPQKDKVARCNSLKEQQEQELNDEVESYLH